MTGGGVVGTGVSEVDITSTGLQGKRVVNQLQPSVDLEIQTVPTESRLSKARHRYKHTTVKEGSKPEKAV